MRVAVIRFPGSNCDQDVYAAIERVGGEPYYLWHRESDLGSPDAVMLPGGFSYGDYLRAGAIATRSPVMSSVIDFANGGGPVLGICNGFQMLCESGLLPGALLRNDTLRFLSTDVHIRVERADTLYTSEYSEGDVLRIPVAHADGNYHADDETLARLNGERLVVFRYSDAEGRVGDANPNGSVDDIAGVLSPNRRVLGMMPHPERMIEPAHGGADGRALFESVLGALAVA